MNDTIVSSKRRLLALLLCWLLGALGGHCFYLGNKRQGWIRVILTVCIIGMPVSFVLFLIDLVNIARGAMRDANGALVQVW